MVKECETACHRRGRGKAIETKVQREREQRIRGSGNQSPDQSDETDGETGEVSGPHITSYSGDIDASSNGTTGNTVFATPRVVDPFRRRSR